MSPPRSSRSRARAATSKSRAPSRTTPTEAAGDSGGFDFMGMVPSPITPATPSVTSGPAVPLAPAARPDNIVVPTIAPPARPRPEAMLPPASIPKKSSNFMDDIPLSQRLVAADPAPISKHTDTTDEIESESENGEEEVEEVEEDEVEEDEDSVQIIEGHGAVGPVADSAAGPSGPSTTRAPTLADLQMNQARIERRLAKIKHAVVSLRKNLAEARRLNHEQNERLLRIDLFMENIVNNFLDPSSE